MATTLSSISDALKLIDSKKQNLKKAFEDLQSQSSHLSSSSFNLNWSDLDSYFSSIESSLTHKFTLLQSLGSTEHQQQGPLVPARPELKSLCEKMDGPGLIKFVMDNRDDRAKIKSELPDAYRCAPDAAALVLDAVQDFNTGKGAAFTAKMSSGVVLLEELFGFEPVVAEEVREKAVKLAIAWKGNVVGVLERQKPMETLGFLYLVSAYGLVDRFSMDELFDLIIAIAKRKQTIRLCRAIIPADKLSDLIRKLISQDMHVQAAKFSIEFDKTDEFHPVTLLKEYRLSTKKLAKKMHKKNNLQASNEATAKELNALRSIIKCIEEYHLESDYPKGPLVALADKLEKEKASKKRPAATLASQPPQKPKAIKHPRSAAPATTVRSNSNIPPQQPHLHPAGLLPDHPGQFLGSPAGPYGAGIPGTAPALLYGAGVPGTNPVVPYVVSTENAYAGSTASPYGLPRARLGFNGNPNPSGANLYTQESHALAGYSYGGYDLPPEYHPSYHPQ